MQVGHHGEVRGHPGQGLVAEHQVVHVGHGDVVENARGGEDPLPLPDLVAVGGIVDAGDQTVGGARPVLVGGVEGGGEARRGSEASSAAS